ncbi:MAG: interleukin-like EMT inducer domain-containing protein [Microcoleaceae cyanobacterium MO_207.B10]|nr:interleukin-like EMT inducer domain-containing protein [Microcoleaceae cyanobacterium MO_207.B10]
MNNPSTNPIANTSNIKIKAESASLNHGNSARITVNNQTVGLENSGRGLNVAVFDELTGQNIYCTTFDTHGYQAASTAFALFIESLPINKIVAIAVKDDANYNLSARAKKACESLGSNLINNLEFRSSFVIIGQKGAKTKTALESLSNEQAVSCERSFSVKPESSGALSISVKSAGLEYGNMAAITKNGNLVNINDGYQRGLNVAIFDESDGKLIDSKSFDLFSDPTAAESFAKLIEGLSKGKIVAIAVKDDATINLSERAKKAFKSIGSSLIDSLLLRGSYAIVGYKGATPGSVVENLSNYELGFVKFTKFSTATTPKEPSQKRVEPIAPVPSKPPVKSVKKTFPFWIIIVGLIIIVVIIFAFFR